MRIYLNKGEIIALTQWKDCPESLKEKLGLTEVYLVEVYNTSSGARVWEAYDRPQKTNMSGEFKAFGWLGTTDNVNRTALGKFSSLKEAVDYLEKEEKNAIEPLDVEENLDDSLVWKGQIVNEK